MSRDPTSGDNAQRRLLRDLRMCNRTEADYDRPMVRRLPQEGSGFQAGDAADQASVDPQRDHVARDVRRFTGSDITKARKQGRPDQVIIADHGGPIWQHSGDPSELPAVQDLAVREMDVRDRDRSEIDNLANAMKHRSGLKRQHDRHFWERHRAPDREAVDAAWHEVALILAADSS